MQKKNKTPAMWCFISLFYHYYYDYYYYDYYFWRGGRDLAKFELLETADRRAAALLYITLYFS